MKGNNKKQLITYVEFKKKRFIVGIDGNTATFMVGSKDHSDFEILDEISGQRFLQGTTSDGKAVAFDISNPYKTKLLETVISYKYKTSTILFGKDHKKSIDSFDAITFYGEAINSLHLPPIVNEIPSDERENKVVFKIDDFEISFVYGWERKKPKQHGDLGYWVAFLKLEFQETQSIEQLLKHHDAMYYLCTFLVGKLNIKFDNVEISKKLPTTDPNKVMGSLLGKNSSEEIYVLDEAGKEKLLLQHFADCHVTSSYYDYAKTEFHKVIAFSHLGNHLAKLIPLFYQLDISFKKNNLHLLKILPTSNQEACLLTYGQIKELCTALEIEYDRLKPSMQLSGDELSQIRKHLKECFETYTNESEISEDLIKQVGDSLNHISLNARNKIIHLVNRAKDKFGEEKITISDDEVGSLVRSRNNLTHSGRLNEDGVRISFEKLKVLLNLSMFLRIGIDDEETLVELCATLLRRI